MAWYSTGTVTVTNNNTTVTGSGTDFISNAAAGMGFRGPDKVVYEIASITSATVLVLATAYGGSTASGQAYSILPTQSLNLTLANQAQSLISTVTGYTTSSLAGKFSSGTTALPGIAFTGDTDSGISNPAANTLAISTGGSESVRIDSSGRVGIGVTPTSTLHVKGAPVISGNGYPYNVQVSGTTPFAAGAGAGITLNGYIDGTTNSYGFGGIHAAKENSTSGNNASYMFFATASNGSNISERMRLDSLGNLGIGKTAMSDIIEAVAPGRAYLTLTAGGAANTAGVKLSSTAGSAAWAIEAGIGSTNNLRIYDTAQAAERLRIDSNGRVGIGTSPAYVLDMLSNAYAVAKLKTSSTTSQAAFLTMSDDDNSFLTSRTWSSANTGTMFGVTLAGWSGIYTGGSTSAGLIIGTSTSVPLLFGTGSAERARFDTNGNLSIGTTSNYATPFTATSPRLALAVHGSKAVQVIRGSHATDPASCGVLALQRTANASADTLSVTATGDTIGLIEASGITSSSTLNPAARIQFLQDGSAGASIVPGAVVVQTNNTGTPAEALRVNRTQQLLVGQTTATGDAKIQVSNGVRFGSTLSSDANTLDYYEEGTFTPTIIGSTTAGTATVSGTPTGFYTRIGNRVDISAAISWTAHTGAGDLLLSGLPFASGNITGNTSIGSAMSSNLTFSGQLVCGISLNTSRIWFNGITTGAANSVIALDTAATLWVSISYQV